MPELSELLLGRRLPQIDEQALMLRGSARDFVVPELHQGSTHGLANRGAKGLERREPRAQFYGRRGDTRIPRARRHSPLKAPRRRIGISWAGGGLPGSSSSRFGGAGR